MFLQRKNAKTPSETSEVPSFPYSITVIAGAAVAGAAVAVAAATDAASSVVAVGVLVVVAAEKNAVMTHSFAHVNTYRKRSQKQVASLQ